MLHSRTLRPGIVTNEILADLGRDATLMFERLWMLADRNGRLEDRPARIRAEAFPYWPDFDVEKSLEMLCQSGFIQRYSARGLRCIVIKQFTKHQHVHPNETASTLPGPKSTARKSITSKPDKRVRNVIGCNDISRNVRCVLPLISKGDSAVQSSVVGSSGADENAPPISTPPPANKRKPPARETHHSAGKAAPPPVRTVPRNAAPDQPAGDMWPHKPEDIAVVRDSLKALAKECNMPVPDDGIVRRVLDIARGAPGQEIHAVLVAMYKRQKFRSMYSWGLVPLVVGQAFQAA